MFRWPQNGRSRSTKSSNISGEVFLTTARKKDSKKIDYFEEAVLLKQQLKHRSSFVRNF